MTPRYEPVGKILCLLFFLNSDFSYNQCRYMHILLVNWFLEREGSEMQCIWRKTIYKIKFKKKLRNKRVRRHEWYEFAFQYQIPVMIGHILLLKHYRCWLCFLDIPICLAIKYSILWNSQNDFPISIFYTKLIEKEW